jgi:hypothetical protein
VWTEQILILEACARSQRLNAYFDRPTHEKVRIIEKEEFLLIQDQISANQDKLALSVMEKAGLGVRARGRISKDERIAWYSGLVEPFMRQGTEYSFGFATEPSGEKILNIEAKEFRNIGGFFQHFPSDISNLEFAQHINRDDVATANLRVEHLWYNGFPIVVFTALRDIEIDEVLGWDYELETWVSQNMVPNYYFKTGKLISDDDYIVTRFAVFIPGDMGGNVGSVSLADLSSELEYIEFFVIYRAKAADLFKELTSSKKPYVVLKYCETCRLAAPKMSQCERCKKVNYCSRKCQASHWLNGHKTECKPAQHGEKK